MSSQTSPIELYEKLWTFFFTLENFHPQDKRIELINLIYSFFKSDGNVLIESQDFSYSHTIFFDISKFKQLNFPFPDLESILISRYNDLNNCISISLSRIANEIYLYLDNPIIIHSSFYNFESNRINFNQIKSNYVGQLVTLVGNIIKVTNCKPMLKSANFICLKCKKEIPFYFIDGIFNTPTSCQNEKCLNKYFELDKKSIITENFQRIKLTEISNLNLDSDKKSNKSSDSFSNNIDFDEPNENCENSNIPRIPKTLEIELHNNFINTCFVGDTIQIVGLVKSMTLEPPKYFRNTSSMFNNENNSIKESGLHQLYIIAESILCIKSSGNRSNSNSKLDYNFLLYNDNRYISNFNSFSNLKNPLLLSKNNQEFSRAECNLIKRIALSPLCLGILTHNFCPIICGNELVKFGILLAMFGGTNEENLENNNFSEDSRATRVRSNIHLLIVGDPGLGKSQMLRAVTLVSPRSILVTGNTTTTAGLTVSISKDSNRNSSMNELNIEAGALILADQGICCIDEFDKINCDEYSLLEAMEQQSISIAKGGVVTSLKCNTSIIAAANPINGHYNNNKSLNENIKMKSSLLSRFDLIFILLDRPDDARDQIISEHIMDFYDDRDEGEFNIKRRRQNEEYEIKEDDEFLTLSQTLKRQIKTVKINQKWEDHQFNSSNNDFESKLYTLRPEQIKRYLEYAKKYVHPTLTKNAAKILQKMYLKLRSHYHQSSSSASSASSLPVTTRHLESLIRLSQARARMELSSEVTEKHAQDVVNLLQESLLDLVINELGEIDTVNKGHGGKRSKQMKLLVNNLTKESTIRNNKLFHRDEILKIYNFLKLDYNFDDLIEMMRTECYLLMKGPKLYQLQTI